jgi:hypothetical protein
VRDHVCALCGSAYFSSKGLRKHERSAHPDLKPTKPKPFKIGSADETNQKPGGVPPANQETASIGRQASSLVGGAYGHQQQLLGSSGQQHTDPQQQPHHLANSRVDNEAAAEMNLQLAYAAAAAAMNRNSGSGNGGAHFFTPLRG